MAEQQQQFWKDKSLHEMTQQEWESLCDGCAKCCLVKLQDDETEEIAYTSVGCQYLDAGTCQCTQYGLRKELVSGCISLQPDMVDQFNWLPDTCAYRLASEGNDLPVWHHLVSGDRDTVHQSGNSVQDKIHSEADIDPDDLEDYIVYWVD